MKAFRSIGWLGWYLGSSEFQLRWSQLSLGDYSHYAAISEQPLIIKAWSHGAMPNNGLPLISGALIMMLRWWIIVDDIHTIITHYHIIIHTQSSYILIIIIHTCPNTHHTYQSYQLSHILVLTIIIHTCHNNHQIYLYS